MVQVAEGSMADTVRRTTFWSAALTAGVGVVSLGVAVATPPRSGPFAAPDTALTFPYADAGQFVPRDFLWMYPALVMLFVFLVLAVCLRENAAGGSRLFSTVGLCLVAMSVAIIAVDYFVQLQTVQPALLGGEGESVAAISQYNPHGVFITLENLGFLLLSISFAFLAPGLGRSRAERAVRWIYYGCAAIAVAAFIGMWSYFGMRLEYLFEVAVISLVWLTLIITSALLAFAFRPGARA